MTVMSVDDDDDDDDNNNNDDVMLYRLRKSFYRPVFFSFYLYVFTSYLQCKSS